MSSSVDGERRMSVSKTVEVVIGRLSGTHGLNTSRFSESTFVQFVKTAMQVVENIQDLEGKGNIKHEVVVGVMHRILARSDLSNDAKARMEHMVESVLDSIITALIESSKSKLFIGSSCFDSVSKWLVG